MKVAGPMQMSFFCIWKPGPGEPAALWSIMRNATIAAFVPFIARRNV
jgi:hypothetical protein